MSKAARILIVDDASSLRSVLRSFFASEGYEVVGELAHGGGLIDSVTRLKPDVVCLDYNLPGSEGLDLLKQLCATHPGVAVVLITGDANPALEAQAAEAGAAGFIRKPFTPDRIGQEIRQVVRVLSLCRSQDKAPPLAPGAARARAVVADDSATMRKLLTSILNQCGIAVLADVPDGQQAVDACARHQPELVCLDMDMPVMNGLDALAHIKVRHPGCKVLMITGRMSRESVQTAGQRGASGYILKPFDPDKVSEAVTRLLGLSR